MTKENHNLYASVTANRNNSSQDTTLKVMLAIIKIPLNLETNEPEPEE